MPFGSNWGEELVAEWLDLEGYFIKMHIPAGSTEAGGRFAPDIVGIRFGNNGLEILHVEVGALYASKEEVTEKLKKKFSSEVEKNVKSYVAEKFCSGENIKISYNKLVVSSYFPEGAREEVAKEQIEIKSINDVIDEILNKIKNKEYRFYKSKVENPTLPDHLWLAKMLEHIHGSYELKRKEKNKRNKKPESFEEKANLQAQSYENEKNKIRENQARIDGFASYWKS
jgi:leucyl aminopeptidase